MANIPGMSLPTSGNLSGFALLAALSAVALGGGGCATGGPNHVYFTSRGSPAVHDLGPPPALIDRAVRPDERVLGLAYDFNTDHLFLRMAFAQTIRVVERPSGKILREMPLPEELHTPLPADLAIRSSDRHLFAAHPDGRSVVELTLFGKFVRRLELPGLGGRIGGLAFDQRLSRLLVLARNTVVAFTPEGGELDRVMLDGLIDAKSLGYDSDAQHFFVPMLDANSIGEFAANGNLVRTIPAGPVTALDAGPRAFLRVC